MRLLDRYLFRELLVPLGLCLLGFLIFFVSFDLVSELDDLQKHKLRGLDVAQLYLFKMPEFIVQIFPIALLLALLYALTLHARHNELTAIRAAGIGLWRLSLPYFGVGLMGCAAIFVLNEFVVPRSDDIGEKILERRTPSKASAEAQWETELGFDNSRDHRQWFLDYNPQTRQMRDVHIAWRLPDGSRRLIMAESAWRSRKVWIFSNVQSHVELPGSLFPVHRISTNLLAIPELTETPDQIRSDITISRRLANRGFKGADIPLKELLSYLRLHPKLSRADKSWLYTRIFSRLAMPFTSVVVVVIALPFGALSGRRNVFVGVAGSICVCIAFFFLSQLGLALGSGGYVPAWLGAWFPNLFFGIMGAWLAARIR